MRTVWAVAGCSVRCSESPQALPDADLRRLLDAIRQPINAAVAAMPSHQQFLDSYCKAPQSAWDLMHQRAQAHARVTAQSQVPSAG